MREAFALQPTLASRLTEPDPGCVLAPLAAPGLTGDAAAGLDLILEGFLLHHGRPRHLDLPESGRRVLAGDYCYAHGLVQVAATGDLDAVRLLADLVALSAALVATGDRGALAPLWRATVATIADPGPERGMRLADATAALREAGDAAPLLAFASELAPTPELDEALNDA